MSINVITSWVEYRSTVILLSKFQEALLKYPVEHHNVHPDILKAGKDAIVSKMTDLYAQTERFELRHPVNNNLNIKFLTMTPDDLKNDVWKLIDEHSEEMTKKEWVDFLYEIADDAKIRAEACESEIEDENEEHED